MDPTLFSPCAAGAREDVDVLLHEELEPGDLNETFNSEPQRNLIETPTTIRYISKKRDPNIYIYIYPTQRDSGLALALGRGAPQLQLLRDAVRRLRDENEKNEMK